MKVSGSKMKDSVLEARRRLCFDKHHHAISQPSRGIRLSHFITNFADEAVILPLAFAIACTLAALGWRRGAVAWALTVGATLALLLCLKLVAFACGPPLLRSPSGHTAAAAVALGGLSVVLGHARRSRVVLMAAAGTAILIGASRLALRVHTPPEVVLGGLVGVAGALALDRFAGPAPRTLPLRWLATVSVIVLVLFHGLHLNAEPRIHRLSLHAARDLNVCRGARVAPAAVPAHAGALVR